MKGGGKAANESEEQQFGCVPLTKHHSCPPEPSLRKAQSDVCLFVLLFSASQSGRQRGAAHR